MRQRYKPIVQKHLENGCTEMYIYQGKRHLITKCSSIIHYILGTLSAIKNKMTVVYIIAKPMYSTVISGMSEIRKCVS